MKTGLPKWWVGDVGLRLPSAAISYANYDLPDCVRLMARWLATRPEVSKVLHPGLESDPGHAIWKRDFTGASGLFSIVLEHVDDLKADLERGFAAFNAAQ
jgi:cystathionine beta-lyase/cystathionine gamma-synthase